MAVSITSNDKKQLERSNVFFEAISSIKDVSLIASCHLRLPGDVTDYKKILLRVFYTLTEHKHRFESLTQYDVLRCKFVIKK